MTSRQDKLKARRRIDVLKVLSNTEGYVVADFDERNFGKMKVLVQGPVDSPYEGGTYQLDITLLSDYPLSPPVIKCDTSIWHPNISVRGVICVDFLDDNWMAAITLLQTIEGIQGLLRNPNANSPLNSSAAVMMRRSDDMFAKTATIWTKTFAGGMTSVADYEEKVSVVTALGATRDESVKRLSYDYWNLETAITSLNL